MIENKYGDSALTLTVDFERFPKAVVYDDPKISPNEIEAITKNRRDVTSKAVFPDALLKVIESSPLHQISEEIKVFPPLLLSKCKKEIFLIIICFCVVLPPFLILLFPLL